MRPNGDRSLTRTGQPVEPRGLWVVRLFPLLALLYILSYTVADPDLWGHVAFGRDIVYSKQVPRYDAYSFTSDRPWVNHEWLAEIVMFLAYRAGSSAGLVLVKTALIAAALAMLAATFQRTVLSPQVRDALLLVLAVALYSWTSTFRPQIFSICLFSALILVLDRARRHPRILWFAPAIFAAWVNLHGGWMVGAAWFAAIALLENVPPLRSSHTTAWMLAAAASACALFLNPYGPQMLSFLRETVHFGRAEIQDWQPITRAGVTLLAIWAGLAVLLAAGLVNGRFTGWRESAAAALLGAGAFRVHRLLPFFALAVVYAAVPGLAHQSLPKPRPQPLPWGVSAIIVATWLLAAGFVLSPNLRCLPIAGTWIPDVAAGRYLATGPLQGNLLTWFDWGEYAIWHLPPRFRVSLDGRRETVYSDRMMELHLAFYDGRPGTASFPDEIGANVAWLPTNLPGIERLRQTNWTVRFRTATSTVLSRDPGPRVEADTPPGDGLRCFPGP